MKTRSLLLIHLLIILVMLLSACQVTPTPSPTATPAPQPAAATPTTAPAPTPTPGVVVYPREKTLYTSGTQWGPPSNWNPLQTGTNAMGTIGLCYETLFLYDPLKDEYIPWLAESGQFVKANRYLASASHSVSENGQAADVSEQQQQATSNVYELKLRQGITWHDGRPLTSADVVYTFELGKLPGVYYGGLWNWLEKIEAVDERTVRFTFKEVRHQEWGNLLYSVAIVPKHAWEGRSEKEIVEGQNLPPLCSGAYMYESHSPDRVVWKRYDNWWATKLLGKSVAPEYIVDIVNPSNNVALGLVLKGEVDLSNNFLPGIATLVHGGYGIKTWYDQAPYMLSANTAFLFMNLKKKPLDDPNFRRALAFAINVDEIVTRVYGNIVRKADPTGLLPVWERFVDQDVVRQLGFTYDPNRAKQILAQAGYRDRNGDGFVEAPDGSAIQLKIIVPFGWTDWMEAAKAIASSAQAAGINLQTDFPDFPAYWDQLTGGTFDTAINNFGSQMSNTPWTFYSWLFNNPIVEKMTSGNFGRYENQQVFDLLVQLNKVPVGDTEGMRRVISQIQRIQLNDMPAIPLWYNGLWAQWNTINWTGWPSAAADAPKYLPCTWRGYWNMTALLMLTELKPAPKQGQ